ncbi:MAG: glycosyltransferase, partial [Acidobacteriota bacterium]
VRREILEYRPDLLLVPSPLEATADHRAAFAAVHEVLGPVRSGDPGDLAAAVRNLTVLAYEVNHPAYPDLLVDVSAELDRLRAAMDCYASQQERHDYLAAGLGLRAFRTLSLPAAGRSGPLRGAEGYRRLAPADFAGRSPAQLVRHLGGAPELHTVAKGPPVSVIVRTKDRPELLAEALASLADGVYRRVEVVVVNDGGQPPALPEDYPLSLRRIDLPETRGRAEAANAGVAAATGEWIGFLDDDDLAAPEHLAVLAGAAGAAGVRAVYSDAAVVTCELDRSGEPGGWREAERRVPYSRDFDPDLLLVDNYIPFNTILFERSLLRELDRPDAPFDPELPIFEDWDLLVRLSRLTRFHHVRRVTCEYRHFRGAGHHALGDRPRERADFLDLKARVIARHADRLGPDRLAAIVDRLRAETVLAAEAAATARRERSEAVRERAALEDRHHRLNGAVQGLREEGATLRRGIEEQSSELDRLYGEEKALREAVDRQEEHLGRTYAEIERLNGILDRLRGASFPGLLRWWRDQRTRARREGEE